jgi:hypothetical protein
MPDVSGQRRFPRYAIQLPFAYTVEAGGSSGVGGGWTRSLSEGGASVEVAQRIRLQVPLRLHLLTDRGRIDAEGRVIWLGKAAPAEGGIIHGLAFTQVAPAHLQILRDLFRALALRREAGVRLRMDLPVTCEPKDPAGPLLQGRTGNVSRGGLFLHLPRLLAPGTLLTVTLHTPRGPLPLEGVIAWVEPLEMWTLGEAIGHGFRFAAASWSALHSLGLLLMEPA